MLWTLLSDYHVLTNVSNSYMIGYNLTQCNLNITQYAIQLPVVINNGTVFSIINNLISSQFTLPTLLLDYSTSNTQNVSVFGNISSSMFNVTTVVENVSVYNATNVSFIQNVQSASNVITFSLVNITYKQIDTVNYTYLLVNTTSSSNISITQLVITLPSLMHMCNNVSMMNSLTSSTFITPALNLVVIGTSINYTAIFNTISSSLVSIPQVTLTVQLTNGISYYMM
jgi:hypothetical protein